MRQVPISEPGRCDKGRPSNVQKLYYAVTGDPNEKVLRKYASSRVNDLETGLTQSNDDLRAMTQSFQACIAEATTELAKNWRWPSRNISMCWAPTSRNNRASRSIASRRSA